MAEEGKNRTAKGHGGQCELIRLHVNSRRREESE